MLRKIAKQIRIIPRNIRWNISINKFLKDYKSIKGNEKLISELFYGWGNSGYAAKTEYLKEIIEQSFDNTKTVLECGTGLSTIILGVIGKNLNFKVVSLENNPEWSEFIKRELKKRDLKNVEIIDTPIIEYDNFDWYDTTNIPKKEQYELIICDGPPSKTKGGRYGLLPLLSDLFADNFTILLDDLVREEEKKIASLWAKEFHLDFKILGNKNNFAILKK
jgi:hypothetical protein